MNMKRIVSLTALLTFIVTVLTSVILYIVPEGRIAYWADWRLWSLSKEQWGAIHINAGFLFLVALLLHLYYNWKSIVLYLKNSSRDLRIFTKEFNVALILTLVFVIGTYLEIPPLSTIINVSDSFKEAAAKEYGEPPYGHAELSSLRTLAKKTDVDPEKGLRLLRESGYTVDSDSQTLKEIAEINGVSPQKIYFAMSGGKKKSTVVTGKSKELPESPVPGTGDLTLADFCIQYNLNLKVVVRSLKESGMESKAGMTLKEIGKENNVSPLEVYERIKTAAVNKSEK
ncbi:MAG TPA: DUF4405 domain-containing protein [Spirochaetota bacterium]|nr:DUF4405 domain-containing protein [Spirochaetota bacterium]